MALNKLPGIYFSETVESMNVDYTGEKIPLFMVYSTTDIPALTGKISKFNVTDFKTAVGENLPKTLEFIQQEVNESGTDQFYIYAVKENTADAYKQALIDTTLYEDIENVFYFEEYEEVTGTYTSDEAGNTQKLNDMVNQLVLNIQGFKAGVTSNAQNGIQRIVYFVPYAIMNFAVSNKNSDVTAEETIINTYEDIIVDEICSGRICTIMPDNTAGIVAGKIFSTAYNEEIGFNGFNTTVSNLTYNFSYTQYLSLQSMGVIFVKQESYQGNQVYRINLGITTNMASSDFPADSILIHRRISDELLGDVKYVCANYLKGKETQSTLAQIQADIDALIKEYTDNDDIDDDYTELTVSESSTTPITWNIVGTIKPARCVGVIEVNTTLQ